MRKGEVEKHDDGGFGVQTRQGNQTDPYGDTHVVVKEVEKPDGSDEREGNRQKYDARLDDGLRAEVGLGD